MAFLDFLKEKKNRTLFGSYWIHTITQFAVLTFFFIQSEVVKLLFIGFLSKTINVLVYIAFQFPITGLLVIFSDNVMRQFAKGQGLFFRVVFSTGLFVVLATCIFFLLIALLAGSAWGLLLQTTLTFVTPVFLVGELFRQRFVLKKVHGSSES